MARSGSKLLTKVISRQTVKDFIFLAASAVLCVGSDSTICAISVEKHLRAKCINRGSYMSAHLLLNLLDELRKSDKMRGLSSILSLFRNKFNKFNNTRTRFLDLLDSNYHMTLKLLKITFFGVDSSRFSYLYLTL